MIVYEVGAGSVEFCEPDRVAIGPIADKRQHSDVLIDEIGLTAVESVGGDDTMGQDGEPGSLRADAERLSVLAQLAGGHRAVEADADVGQLGAGC